MNGGPLPRSFVGGQSAGMVKLGLTIVHLRRTVGEDLSLEDIRDQV